MSKIYKPVKNIFKNPIFKDMDDYDNLVKKFDENYEETWGELAKENIFWQKPFTKVLDESNAPFNKWFKDGKMSVAYECVDKHLKTRGEDIAILFEADDGTNIKLTYNELAKNVNKTANLFTNVYEIKKGDRVVVYMPMILEAIYTMLACAKIGAIHSVVFGGFSSSALRDRIIDAKAKLVVTADGAYRKGKPYMLKPAVDEAMSSGCESVQNVCVIRRNFEPIETNPKDSFYDELIQTQKETFQTVWFDSEDPLFLLYTSGSTGQPKGVQHNMAGYILWAKLTMKWVFDNKPDDTFWCTADIGWITGHSYIVYGPLANGTTTVVFEGVPTYPDAGRCWKMVEQHKIDQFYTAPTAIRMLHKTGEDEPGKYDLSSLRVLGTVGEPIDPPAWKWYYETVGNSRCSIVDTWWQTETGGHMVSPIASCTPIRPGCATLPLPGIQAKIIEQDGTPTPVGEKGYLCITKPWPSQIRTIWGDEKRFIKSYFGDCVYGGKPVYFSGDGAMIDESDYITITGRTDDVINVSGHRIGTAEIEASIKDCDMVASSAVVGKPHEIKGEAIFGFIVLKDENSISKDDLKIKLNKILKEDIGAIALLDDIVIVPDLPKTRSGKIMRRILRSIVKGEAIVQDISTLEDPNIVSVIEKLCV
ncbi:MAG: acetate--CoA ligase [Campylobacteraceae bacterium 4484_166]|nr:MAG: acetate--CoA ligase [Campylobacteraceae bacterium 4484_166]